MKTIKRFFLPILILSSASFTQDATFPFPSFNSGMNSCNTYQESFAQAPHWGGCKKLYEEYTSEWTYQEEPIIPKIIHQIWLGSPFPERCKKFRDTWLKHHPTWKYKLWTEKEIRELGLVNLPLYNRASNYGEKSDIARYEILYRFGGVYVDADFECIKPFDMFAHSCCFFVGLLWPRSPEKFNIANGLIGSVPGHPVLKECIYTMKHNNQSGAMAIIDRTGPYHLARCFKRLLLANALPKKSVPVPVNFFYSFPAWERAEKREAVIKSWLKEYSFAIHYWHAAWA